jgi:hypothetical protein
MRKGHKMNLTMRSIMPRLAAALLTLGIGVAAASFWLGLHEPKDKVQPTQVHESSTAPPPEAFIPLLDKGGDWNTSVGCIHDEFYRAWDGSEVWYSHVETGSPAQAAKQMRKSTKILYAEQGAERSDVLDGGGQKVGERLMGLRRTDTKGRKRVAILWVEGSKFFTIEGDGLERILEFSQRKVER